MSEDRGPAAVVSAVELLMPKPTHRFPVLDLLRGVVAMCVVCIHNEGLFGVELLRHGYLAVDFFFMLSGFVLTLAYQSRLNAGWPTWRFMRARLIRVFPLYVFALALFALYLVRIARLSLAWHVQGMHLLMALFMIPSTPWRRDGNAYPYNMPSWSLALELLVNVIHGIWLRKRSLRFLVLAAAGTGAAVVVMTVRFGTIDVGSLMSTFPAALPRTLFSYLLGMILYRLWQRDTLKIQAPAAVMVLALLIGLSAPHLGKFDVFYDAAVILILFPAMLLAGACAVTSPGLRRASDLLGRSSYAVYVIHFPLMFWWPVVRHRLHLAGLDLHVPFEGIVFLFIVFLVAVLLDAFYDGPVRNLLQGRNMWAKAGS